MNPLRQERLRQAGLRLEANLGEKGKLPPLLQARKGFQGEKSLAGPFPTDTPSPSQWAVNLKPGAAVFYSRTLKRITLQRFILSKMVWKLETVSWTEVLVLYDNLLWCQDKAFKDQSFREKFGKDLESLTEILKKSRFSENSYRTTIKKVVQEVRELLPGFLIPARNLSTVEKHVKGRFTVKPTKDSGVPVRDLPPVKVIGRGYRDHGSCRDPAWDASPGWKEVATYFSNLERLEDETG